MSNEVSQETIQELAKKGRESLFFFARAILGFDKLTPHIHKPICQTMQNYEENTRVCTVLPRDWFKSTICSIAYPIWRAINNPNVRILVVQNSYSNACKKLNNIKQLFETNELFKACYPEILPNKNCVWKNECLTVNRKIAAPEGTFEAAGTGTAVTSRHYDVIIQDDTVSPDRDALTGTMMQPTRAEIEKAIGWHRLSHPLLIDPKDSQIIVVGTRWAEEDLIGWIFENAENTYEIITRAVRETDGKPDVNGEIVWERFDEEVLRDLERDLGPYMFSALYMNHPMSATNQVFKREWINYYYSSPQNLIYFTSVDVAAAANANSSDPDYNVVTTIGINPANGHIYIFEYTRDYMNPGEVIDTIFEHVRRYTPRKVIIESIAYQRTINYWIREKMRKVGIFFIIEEVKSLKGSKEDRIRALQPYFANNKIFLRQNMDILERELLAFPNSRHDDVIDTIQLQLSSWTKIIKNYEKKHTPEDKYETIHSGRRVIEELQGRVKKLNKYPYDIGHLRETVVQRREYVPHYN